MQYHDYYRTLGVDRNASSEDIKKAYRRLARKYHPDVSKEADAEARFKEVAEAYEVLRDADKRAAYDQLGSNWRSGQDFRPPPGWEGHFHQRRGGAAPGGNFSDFFESLFGGGSPFDFDFESTFGERRGRARPGQDSEAELSISLSEAYAGATRTVTLPGPGGGRQLRVKIPAGTRDGQQIRLAGQGKPGLGGAPAGDLRLRVQVLPHELFRLEGRDVHLELPVTPWEAALGARVQAPTLGGRVGLQIPPGSQSGRRLRLKGRGLPGSPPGDQYVTLRMVTPEPKTPAQEKLYRRMAEELAFDPRARLGS